MIDQAAARRQETSSTRLRKKGDALRQRGDVDQARTTYADALAAIDRALVALGHDDHGGTDEPVIESEYLGKIADLLGIRGGLLRRLDRLEEALASYRRGAEIESTLNLQASYNRTNAVKLALLLGATTLTDARPALVELRDVFERRLKSDEEAADDAWLWADLADCRLLLGQVSDAENAYLLFAQKAETRSPVTTLAVLEELANSLSNRGDPLAPQLVEALGRVRHVLTPDQT